MSDHAVICPHCGGMVVVAAKDINCKIFRHGVIKATGQPMDPHTPKKECARLIREGLIYGCAGPFKFDGVTTQVCDYI